MTEKLLDISEINVTDGEDVNGFGRLIISLLHENGRIVLDRIHHDRNQQLIKCAKSWLKIVQDNVELLDITYRTSLMDRYDILYRCVYSMIPDLSFINRQRYSVIDSLIKGNSRIDVEETLWMITSVCQLSKTFGFPVRAKILHDSILKLWVEEFDATNSFINVSQSVAIRRVLTILREDISSLTKRPEKLKVVAASSITPMFKDFNNQDSKTLESMYLYLAYANGRYVDSDLAWTQMIEILKLLSVMPQVNKFDRQAYANDLRTKTKYKWSVGNI